jgi:hypothetical protein
MSDNEEWGNIELPGLSDEELFKKNWHIIGIRQTEEYRQRMSEIATRQKADETYCVNHKAAMTRLAGTKEYSEIQKASKKNIKNNKEWLSKVTANNRKNANAQRIPIMTDDGIMESKLAASIFYNVDYSTIGYRIKSKNYPNFRFLTPEEAEEWKKNNL